ncbi:hypothetical protein HQ586_10445 [Candidatus Bathyarchaeota archaeon]|nr:hypothetical protein [Candidatus Bathyarchaeota archaeon]
MPDLDALRCLLERRGAPKPPKSPHRWGELKIDEDSISPTQVGVFSVCESCGARTEYLAVIGRWLPKWELKYMRYVVPENYKETECYLQRTAMQSVLSEVRGYTETDPDLLTPPLEERAENVPASVLARLGSIDERVIFRLTDYFANDLCHPLFMLGPKGIGKTFTVLKALNRRIRETPDFLPVMFIYRKNNTFELLPPLALADAEDWGERLSFYEDMDDERLKTLLERADAIVMDDLHYRCEAILNGETSLGLLIADLMLILELVETGKKVLLVSEMPLAYYGDIIEDEEFDEVLAYYGQVPYRIRGRRYRELMKKGSVVSGFEVPPIEYDTWCRLFDTYGFTSDDVVRQILYHISDKPRFFIRMMRLFEDQESRRVDVEALCREAEKRRADLGMKPIVRRQRQSDRDLEYISKVSKELYAAITESLMYVRYGDDAIPFIAQRFELVKTVCWNIARTMGMPTALKPGQARRWGDPFYAVRTLEKMTPSEFEVVFEKVLDLYMPEYPVNSDSPLTQEPIARALEWVFQELEKERREEFKSLVQLCYRTRRMTHFMRYYYQQEYSDIEVTEDDIFYNKHRYVEAGYRGCYILLEPFRKAFQGLTENKRLIEGDARKFKRGWLRVQRWASILTRRHGLKDLGLPEAHGTVKCPVCGEDAESYTLVDGTLRELSVYRHSHGKSLGGLNVPENSPPSAYNLPGLRYHYILEGEQ